MKNQSKTIVGLVAISTAWASNANANVWVAGVNGSMSVAGTSVVIEGDQFSVGGSGPRWDDEGVVGTDYVATSNTVSSDRYFQLGGANITGLNLLVSDYRYVEVYYSLSSTVAIDETDAADNRFFISNNGSGAGSGTTGQNPNDGTLIPSTAGTHRFVLDLLSTDGTTLDGNFDGTANWDLFRWDPWNNTANATANAGIVFTLDKVVYGTALTAVPEPSSLALLGLGGLGLLSRRRR